VAPDPSPPILPDNIRLPDALTVRHGSGPRIGRIVLEGDRAARDAGIRLHFRTDWSALVALNAREVARGNWRELMGTFNPAVTDLSRDNAFWIAGENGDGEIVTTSAGRLYQWPDTTLADHAVEVFFGRDAGQQCVLTAPAAQLIGGAVFTAGTTWVRPDYRGRELSQLMSRLARALAMARWPLDWTMAFIQRPMAEGGVASGYGSRHLSYSVFFPETPYGEIAISYTSGDEIYDDFGSFLGGSSLASGRKFLPRSPGTSLTHEVMKTSPEGARQGSSNRS
jgi:GNAT superfamily N-acetyltransferase